MPALITWWTRDIALLSPEAPAETVHAAGADLLRRWSEARRSYHTTTHLVEMFWALEELEEAGETDAREGAVGRVAAWFHVAVYTVPDATGNEVRSAAVASESLRRLGFHDRDLAVVDRLIRASERHALPDRHGLDGAFHDADLWILSAPEGRFDTYCRQVREEYAQVPDAAYATGRSAILAPFLERPRIYATDAADAGWTGRARENLHRELARLSPGQPG
jgi:predicted metal-dependent HD superfamily phosphohydrolase